MNLHSLKPAAGSVKTGKRLGRGQGSGKGGTSTKGHNGQKSRSGYKRKIGFEGGQMPLNRRVPKFGFTNPNRVEYQVVNLSDLQRIADKFKVSELNIETLKQYGAIASKRKPVKILGRGELKAAMTIKVHACSETAKSGIEENGGSIELL